MADSLDPLSGPASIDSDMIKAAQDLKLTMADLTTMSKQMTDAINSMVKPLKEISDLSKAIKDNNKEAVKATKDIDDETKKVVDSTRKLKEAHSDTVKAMLEVAFSTKELNDVGEAAAITLLQMVERENEASAAWEKINEKNREYQIQAQARRAALDAEAGILTTLVEKASRYKDAMAIKHPTATRAAGITSGTFAETMTGHSRITESVGAIGKELKSFMPMLGGIGGLLGLMISGRIEDAKFDAIAQISKQAFDNVGGASKEFAASMGSAARELSTRSMAAVEDIAHVNSAFASLGVRSEEAGQKIEGFSSIVGNKMVIAALALDKALEMPAGTMAKMSGTMAQMFNTTAKESLMTLGSLGEAAVKSGGHMVSFMQQTMDASSALRMLNANGTAVGQMQLTMMDKMVGQGMKAPYAQQYAAAGTASAAQAMGGLSVGLSAIIGEKLGMAPGGGGGLDAWYAMKSGSAEAREGGSKLDPVAVASELAKIARQTTANRAEQVYMLTQLTGSTVGGAEAMLDIGDASAKGDKQAVAALVKRMNRGLDSEAEKTSSIDRAVNIIKDGILHIGSGLLTAILNALRGLTHLGMAAFGWLQGKFGTDDDSDRGFARYDVYSGYLDSDVKGMTKGLNRIIDGAKKAGEGTELALRDSGVMEPWFADDDAIKRAMEKRRGQGKQSIPGLSSPENGIFGIPGAAKDKNTPSLDERASLYNPSTGKTMRVKIQIEDMGDGSNKVLI